MSMACHWLDEMDKSTCASSEGTQDEAVLLQKRGLVSRVRSLLGKGQAGKVALATGQIEAYSLTQEEADILTPEVRRDVISMISAITADLESSPTMLDARTVFLAVKPYYPAIEEDLKSSPMLNHTTPLTASLLNVAVAKMASSGCPVEDLLCSLRIAFGQQSPLDTIAATNACRRVSKLQ